MNVNMLATVADWTADSSPKPVVVWHLWRRPNQELWCVVTTVDHRFALMVSRDPDEPAPPMPGRYTDIVSLVRRADQVKREFLGKGWREPELNEDGRAYGRLTLVRSSCSTDAGATVTPSEEHVRKTKRPSHGILSDDCYQ